jgi:hypothetical protein
LARRYFEPEPPEGLAALAESDLPLSLLEPPAGLPSPSDELDVSDFPLFPESSDFEALSEFSDLSVFSDFRDCPDFA